VTERAQKRRGRGRGQIVQGYPRPARLAAPAAGSRPDGGLPQPIPEAALYPSVARWLTTEGYACWRDVSYLGRWIDLLAEHPDGRTIAVELKVVNWRRALQQARIIQPCAQATFIGIWAPYVHRAQSEAALTELDTAGVGLLSINGHCEMIIEPKAGSGRYGRWIQKPAQPSHRPGS
jgi:hypothetical protein